MCRLKTLNLTLMKSSRNLQSENNSSNLKFLIAFSKCLLILFNYSKRISINSMYIH